MAAQIVKPRKARPFAAAKPATSLFTASRPLAPPSEDVVAAVLCFGDQWEERNDGYVTRRFTPERLERDDMALRLPDPEDRARALDVSVIWNETEAEIVRVVDLAPLRAGRADLDQANRYAEARKRSLGRPNYANAA